MKKKNDKGFMLAETLIVTTFVASVLIYLFIQFTNLSKSYDESYIYNTTEGLYALEDIKNYMYSDYEALSFIKSTLNSADYIDISDCSMFNDKEYCKNLFKLENINEIIITNNINEYNNYFDSHSNLVCELVDDADNSGTITLSDVVTCELEESDESFYVMENDGNKVTMLSMYNLDVGNIDYPDYGLTPLENPTGIQNPLARGFVLGDDISYGTVAFSSSAYWQSDVNAYPAYVYNESSNLYQYVNAYETYLKENGVVNAKATLISYGQIIDLKTNKGNPGWLHSTTYWTGSAADLYSVWIMDADDYFDNNGFSIDYVSGVRPVITLPKLYIRNNKNIQPSYPESFKTFLNKIDNTGEEPYRIIASFKDGKYATIRFGG